LKSFLSLNERSPYEKGDFFCGCLHVKDEPEKQIGKNGIDKTTCVSYNFKCDMNVVFMID
jgi:hypothetical protein